jgi:ELWxxDGT repeat protein
MQLLPLTRTVALTLAALWLTAHATFAQQAPQVIDISPGTASSTPGPIVTMGGIAYFAATDPAHGQELWRSDGTIAGTYLVADINPGTGSATIEYLTAAGDQLYFSAFTPALGRELYKSDGTAAGTQLVVDLIAGNQSGMPRNIIPFGSGIALSYCTYATGCELFKSNGTAAGTTVIKDILPGQTSSFPSYLTVLGNLIIFAANDGTNGEELWKSDGTAAGTVMVKNIDTTPLVYPPDGFGRSYPEDLVVMGNKVYFTARDNSHGLEVWRTDGTTAGTVMVRDLYPGGESGVLSSGNAALLVFDNQLIFLGRNGAAQWWTLYVTDGTSAGTVTAGPGSLERVKFNGQFIFNYAYTEPWIGDLTDAGSSQLKDIAPGEVFANAKGFKIAGNAVYFWANNQVNGYEFWRTDGTTAGTALFGDLNPGAASSATYPAAPAITQAGDYLFFAATSAATGLELWTVLLNRAPGADAGADQMVDESEPVTLDGTASSDPDADDLTYEWRDETQTLLGDEDTITISLAPGIHDITLTVSDGELTATDTVRIRVGNSVPVASAGGPYAAVRNALIAFSGAASTDVENDPLTYEWDFGDGTLGTGPSPLHAYQSLGTFTVTLTVHDGFDSSAPVSTTVTITNQAPSAHAGGPYNSVRGSDVSFIGTGSFDPDADALTYAWDFGDGSTGTGAAPVHAYATLGTFTVTLTVHDGTDTSAPTTALVTIANQAPTADAGGPYQGVRNTAITLHGANSSDPDDDELTYAWDFGDGTTGTGQQPEHAYTALGTFTVTLIVSDGVDTSDPVSSTVTITNRAPAANAGGPYSSVRGGTITFNAAASSDPDDDSLTYAWDFGDGTTGTGVAPEHAYTALGSYTVTLTVNDGTDSSAPATATVTVSNQAPVAHAGGPYSAVRNAAIAFSAAASSDPDNDTLTYAWNFGDGATGTGVSPTHTYSTLGTFVVSLIVNDGHESSPAATGSVTITNQSPVANGGGGYAGTRLAAIAFTGAASTDPDNDALTYAWDFGDGATGTGASPSHLYTATGTFVVTLTVHDGHTTSAPYATSVTITNVSPLVSLTAPADGLVVTAPAIIGISAVAADPDGSVTKVEFFAGAEKIGEALGAPYAIAWPGAVPGSYMLTARVTDSSNATMDSAPRLVIVNAAPSAAITSPADNAQFASPASITLTASAADADGTVTQVQFFNGATSIGIATSSPYSVTWTGVSTGSYVVTAVVTDNRGATTTSAPITVKVTATLASTADAYVRASNANSNFGTATTLTVQQVSSNSNIRWTYLKFDTSSVATITNAKVRIYGAVSAITSTAINTAIYPVSNTTWTETGITWNNKPATGATALASVPIVNNSTSSRWYELDVTAYLQAEKAAGRNVVTLALKNLANSSPYVQLVSRQGTAANRPQLVIVP